MTRPELRIEFTAHDSASYAAVWDELHTNPNWLNWPILEQQFNMHTVNRWLDLEKFGYDRAVILHTEPSDIGLDEQYMVQMEIWGKTMIGWMVHIVNYAGIN